MTSPSRSISSSLSRKARGAFFTPPELCDYVVEWAVRDGQGSILEPSCGEAAFLVSAGARLRTLNRNRRLCANQLHGYELHEDSAKAARALLDDMGIDVRIEVGDFFNFHPTPSFDAVVGNPPYIRFQDFSGDARARGKEAALRAGVALTGLASSWAAFTVHAAQFLKPGGRLGLVLPAELLSVNYAAGVRSYLMQRFSRVRLVLFTERVFPDVQEEVVLLLAEGDGPTDHCELLQLADLADLKRIDQSGRSWRPIPPGGKWTASLMPEDAWEAYGEVASSANFTTLSDWGETTLGMVTGNNRYFALSPSRVEELGLLPTDTIPLSPPGSRHLRGLTFGEAARRELGRMGKSTHLFRPASDPSPAALAYVAKGESAGVQEAYKCRVRSPWWRVPLVDPADLLLTYMNADTPRLCTNRARAHHLNSVHGLYIRPGMRRIGCDVLPLAALNSMTLLGAETVGRSYGGGMLKLEPREAARLPVPSYQSLASAAKALSSIRPQVGKELQSGHLADAVRLVDETLLIGQLGLSRKQVKLLRLAHTNLSARRSARGAPPRVPD